MKMVLYSIAAAYLLFIFYLAYCAIWEARRQGKLQNAPLPVRVVVYSILGTMLAADFAFNITVGTVLFLEPPTHRRLLFTQRCAKRLHDDGFRGRIARWVCYGWLNPFQENHCKDRGW